MPSIGTASLNVDLDFGGNGKLTSSVKEALGGVDVSSTGQEIGNNLTEGINGSVAKSGAVMGVFSAVTQSAMSAIGSHVGDAVSRLDTLKNYPLVMESLGVSSEEAAASAQTMSDRLQNVPTRLDNMAQSVQGIYAASQKYGTSLSTATEAGLSLNSMLLAGGGSVQVVNSAMEQFRQMLAKGKPDMQDWKSLVSAAPGQMNQLAEAMLGAGHSADDLYAALGGGKEGDAPEGIEWASISMDQLLEKMVEIGPQFESAAEEAQGGIGTAMANMGNAITRGIADVMDGIGRENIVGAIGDIKTGIRDAFSSVKDIAGDLAPAFKTVWDVVKQLAPTFIKVGAGLAVFNGVPSLIGNVVGAFTGLKGSIMESAGALAGFAVAHPVVAALGAVAVAVGATAAAMAASKKNMEKHEKATKGVSDAIGAMSGAADAAKTSFDVLGETQEHALQRSAESAKKAEEAHDAYIEAGVKAADNISEANKTYQEQASKLEYAGQVIDKYANQTDLTASQQAELNNAVETYNELTGSSLEVVDASTGKIKDENDEILNNTDAIWDNIRAKQAAAKAEALGTAKTELDGQLAEALNSRAAAEKSVDDASAALQSYIDKYGSIQGILESSDMEAHGALGNWKRQVALYAEADAGVSKLAQSTTELSSEQMALEKMASGAEMSLSELALVSDVAMQAFNEGGAKAELSINDFAAALDGVSKDKDKLKDALGSPETMADIVNAYDGTAASLEGVFNDLGIGFDEVKAGELDVASSTQQMANFLTDMGTSGYGAMRELGLSTDEMAEKFQDAGVTIEDLNNLGSENLDALVANGSGDIDELIAAIRDYNGEMIVDKDGNVIVHQDELYDAQGNVYTWNGTDLLDKDGNVVINDKELTDAQGNAFAWNKVKLTAQKGKAEVTGNAVDGTAKKKVDDTAGSVKKLESRSVTASVTVTGTSQLAALSSQLNSLNGKTYTTTLIQRTEEVQSATGGYRVPHADGGYRYHADGFIANNYGAGVPLDIVGEDGAEAIIPLTNQRYAQPFIDMLATGLHKQGAVGGGDVYNTTIESHGTNANELARDWSRSIKRLQMARG